jgi:AP endonuclease-1
MAKKLSRSHSDSSLSPPPDDLPPQAEIATVKTTVSRKRKADTTATTVTKRVKNTTAVKSETADTASGADYLPQPKRRVVKKIEVEEETVEEEVQENGDNEIKTKKKSAPRKRKELNLVPLASRTQDSPLLMGAHVSTSGG